MFFEITQQKIIRITAVALFLIFATVSSIALDNRFNLREKSSIVFQSLKSSFNYLPHQLASVGAYNMNNTGTSTPRAKSVPILLYHAIPTDKNTLEDKEEERTFPINLLDFINQMQTLKKNGWHTVSLEDLQAFMSGDKSLPDKSFVLTFDDGIKSSFYNVDPVLKDLNWNAVMFVPTDSAFNTNKNKDSTYYLSEEELKHMVETGRWEIESHGASASTWQIISEDGGEGHFLSNKIWLNDKARLENNSEYIDRITYDLKVSQKALETRLGIDVNAFAYPFSDFGQESKNFDGAKTIISSLVPKIYDMSFYQTWPSIAEIFNYPDPSSKFFKLRRIEPTPDWDSDKLMGELDRGKAKELPYISDSFGEEWSGTWGNIERGDSLIMEAQAGEAGSAVFLNGSYWWEDYYLKILASWNNEASVSLTVRGQDEDYYACVFSKDLVAIRERVNGNVNTLDTKDFDINNTENVSLGARVNGNSLECLVDDVSILKNGSFENLFYNGSVGIQVWEEDGNAKLIVYEASIQ